MALAIRLNHLIKSGQVTDQAELARVGHVSRARLSQIMDLNLLAPDIQESVLCLDSSVRHQRLPLEREVRKIAAQLNWTAQRSIWISYTKRRNHRQIQGITPNQPNRA